MAGELRKATLCFLLQKENETVSQVCLALKKRGFGKGRWNGVGGKVDASETIESAAKREAYEEIGVKVLSLEKVAVLTFFFPHNPEWDQEVHVFTSFDWEGSPTESEEMQPKWIELDKIPYDTMWPDDSIWLPEVLSGKKVRATFSFGQGDAILDHTLSIVNSSDL